MNRAKDRPFTRLAAEVLGGGAVEALDAGRCPFCNGPVGEFRDELSRREFGISGLCQKCQDATFGGGLR